MSTSDMRGRVPLNILYCHGLGSSINNRMGTALYEYFKRTPHNFERLLYRNPGSREKLWNIVEWKEDIEKRIEGKEWIVMATSAGGQAALNAAKNMSRNVKGLFLFCPGTHMEMSYIDGLGKYAAKAIYSGTPVIHPASRNGHDALVDLHGFELFVKTCVSQEPGPIPITCPVVICHGTEDAIVPYDRSQRLAQRLASKDVELVTIEGGDHYLDFNDTIRTKLEEFLAKFYTTDSSHL